MDDRVISVLNGDPRISWSSKCLLLMVGPEAEHMDLKCKEHRFGFFTLSVKKFVSF